MNKITISVEIRGSFIEKEAYCVAGNTGFLAFWKEENFVHVATGDDGFWKRVFIFEQHWMKNILEALFQLILSETFN